MFYRPQKDFTSEKPANLTNQEEIIYDFLVNNRKIDVKTAKNILNVKSARAREILSNLVKRIS